jgi:hypothetical protein
MLLVEIAGIVPTSGARDRDTELAWLEKQRSRHPVPAKSAFSVTDLILKARSIQRCTYRDDLAGSRPEPAEAGKPTELE